MQRRKDQNFERHLIDLCTSNGSIDNIPLTHISCTHSARCTLKDRILKTTYCKVFKQKLLYFFILRPAYRFKNGEKSSDELSRFPVVFVIKSDAVKSPSHVYPFDTGGAASNAFSERADAKIYLEDYALKTEQTAPAKFINWAFGNLDDYYETRLRPEIENDIIFHKWVVPSYIKIAKLGIRGHNKRDHRASTVEIASRDNVDLFSNLLLIICPYQWIEPGSDNENKEMLEVIQEVGADIKYYHWSPHNSPDSYQEDINRICREWYAGEGILNE